jgi:hypothetical protein
MGDQPVKERRDHTLRANQALEVLLPLPPKDRFSPPMQ